MTKKVLSVFLCVVMTAALLIGCGSVPAVTPDSGNSDGGKLVGVAMPTRSSERWFADGDNMKQQLEELGYKVDLQYADDDIDKQIQQISDMIDEGCRCLVIASIDSQRLTEVENKARNHGIPIIAYDRLLMDTDAVSYYATFDNKMVGNEIGRYIVENAKLDPSVPQTIEFFMGSPDDNNAYKLYAGLMEELYPYINNGSLICKSGEVDFESSCTLRWDTDTARERCERILNDFYTGDELDIVASAFDGLSYGCIDALEKAGYSAGNWPIITGQDAELVAIKDIIDGKMSMTVYKDTRLLASKCVTMVQAVLKGTKPEINDTEQYHNNKIHVPSYLCTPVAVDKNNYEDILIGGGYYTEEQLKDNE